jgi:small-conductance mechanosensitive channel
MQLKYLKTVFDADKYNITEEELEGLPLKDQVELVADKMQQFADQQTAIKEEHDRKAVKAFNEVKKHKKLRAAAQSQAANVRENRGRLLKEYNSNLPLIELKMEKANNE